MVIPMNETFRRSMPRKLRSLALIAGCAAASLAASQCASSSRPGAAADAAPTGDTATPRWTHDTSPQQIAGWARRNCRSGPHQQECVEKALTSAIDSAGVDRVMSALGILAGQDSDIAVDGHVYAHGIGISAYRGAATVGQTFSRCTAEFQSGCYHGVIQAYFADRSGGDAGVTAGKLNALCTSWRSARGRWLDFQCAHGIGHGLMAVESHDLLRALDSCDLLTDSFEKQACWGGAFMENVVNATAPHHMAVTHVADAGDAAAGHEMAGHDMSGHEGHDMAGMPGMAGMDHGGHGAQAFKALDPDDPLYPCDIVKPQHRSACYLMQTSAMLWRNHGNFRDAAETCQTAPADMQRTCFVSLGRDANSWGRGNPDRAIALCEQAPEAAQPNCIVGVVKNMIDVSSAAIDGLQFCRKVSANSKPACYLAVGQEIGLLNATAADRERACQAAIGYVTECRRGAGLPVVPTDD
jgi:hypothetical protein